MAKKKSEDAKWGARIEAAQRVRKAQEPEWRANKIQLLGRDYRQSGFRKGDSVAKAWAAFQQMVGSVYARNPDVIVRETSEALINPAKILTAAVNEDFKLMNARHATRQAICDVFTSGFGLVMEKLQNDITSASYKYTELGEKTEKKRDRNSEDAVAVPTNQRYSLQRIHPEAVLFDPVGISPTLSDHKWISVDFYPTVYELKTDEFFDIKPKTLKGLTRLTGAPRADSERKRDNYFGVSGEEDPDDEYAQVCIREVWDRISRKVYYLPAGVDEIIGERDWPMELRYNGELRFPMVMLYFNENPDVFWPIPEISACRPQFEQFSLLFREILHDATNKFRRYAYRTDLMGDKGIVDRFKSGGPIQLIPIDGLKWGNNANRPLSDVIAPIPDPQVKQDQLAVISLVNQELNEIMGSGDLASGGFRSTRSATEAASLTDFLKSRLGNRTENVDEFFRQLAINHALCLQETAVEPRRIETTDKQGNPRFTDFTKDDVKGNFKFVVTAGSSTPQNTETARQEAIAFGQQVLPIIMQQGGDVRPVIEWLAPLFHMPLHQVEMVFRHHKQALVQAAMLMKQSAIPNQPPPDPRQLTEAFSQVLMTGLNASELAQVDQMVQQQAQNAPAQPVSPPGTNTSNQLL